MKLTQISKEQGFQLYSNGFQVWLEDSLYLCMNTQGKTDIYTRKENQWDYDAPIEPLHLLHLATMLDHNFGIKLDIGD